MTIVIETGLSQDGAKEVELKAKESGFKSFTLSEDEQCRRYPVSELKHIFGFPCTINLSPDEAD